MADEHLPEVHRPSMTTGKFIKAATLFQLSLAAIGIYFGVQHGFRDPDQDLGNLDWGSVIQPALIWGTLGTIPLLSILVIDAYFPFGPFKHVQAVVKERLYPLLKNCSIWQMAFISLLAGSTEEVLFRWCLQGGLAESIPGPAGSVIALLIASVLFGAVHCINFSYAFLTTVIGLYLGGMMILSGTWLAPAITHTLYDFIAIYFIARVMPMDEIKSDRSSVDQFSANERGEASQD